jgi:hypothetical protein
VGESFKWSEKIKTYYFIQYGFVKGMVKKQDVKLGAPLADRLKRSVIGTKDLQVYIFQNGSQQSIGKISAGVRYPVKQETKLFMSLNLEEETDIFISM